MSTETLRLELDVPEATESQAENGWSLEYKFLEKLTDKIRTEKDDSLCQEQVENVILTLLEISEV